MSVLTLEVSVGSLLVLGPGELSVVVELMFLPLSLCVLDDVLVLHVLDPVFQLFLRHLPVRVLIDLVEDFSAKYKLFWE